MSLRGAQLFERRSITLAGGLVRGGACGSPDSGGGLACCGIAAGAALPRATAARSPGAPVGDRGPFRDAGASSEYVTARGVNAVIDSCWARRGVKLVDRWRWSTPLERSNVSCGRLVFIHEPQRRHSSVGMFTPVEYAPRHPITSAGGQPSRPRETQGTPEPAQHPGRVAHRNRIDDVAGHGHRVDAVGRIVVDRRVDDADAVGAAVARALVDAHRRTINRGWRQRGARAGDATSSAIKPRWSRPAGQEEGNLRAFRCIDVVGSGDGICGGSGVPGVSRGQLA